MPIVSMNISDSMKKFLKKMVHNKEYKNNSNVMRDALVRLMSEKDGATGELVDEKNDFVTTIPTLSTSILLSLPNLSTKIEKKITRIEISYHSSIVHKSVFSHNGFKTYTYVLDDTMMNIQSFITELNAIENIQAFRYIINDTDEEEVA